MSCSWPRSVATVVSVHYDDELPYYTIRLGDGRERSVERSRLSLQRDAFSLLSVDELALVLEKTHTQDNGWFIAAKLQRCCKALNEAVAAWRDRVTELSFAGCDELDDTNLRRIGAACGSRLRAIDVSSCARVTDASVAQLVAASPSLRRLVLSKCHTVSEESLRAIAYSPCARALEHLDLSSCRFCAKADVLAVVGEVHSLHHLDLSFCTLAITDEVLAAIATSPLPLLRSLLLKSASAADSRGLSDEGIEVLVGSRTGKSLTHLDLTYAGRLTDASLRTIAEHCPALCALSVHGCIKMGDSGVQALGSYCPRLERLDLTQLQLSSSSVGTLAKGCPALATLVVDHCRHLGVDAWTGVASQAPANLAFLSVVNAGGLTDASIRLLVDSLAPLSLRLLRLGPAVSHPDFTLDVAAELRERWCSTGLVISGGPQASTGTGKSKRRR